MGKSHYFGHCNTCKEARERCDSCRQAICGCTDCGCYSEFATYWGDDDA